VTCLDFNLPSGEHRGCVSLEWFFKSMDISNLNIQSVFRIGSGSGGKNRKIWSKNIKKTFRCKFFPILVIKTLNRDPDQYAALNAGSEINESGSETMHSTLWLWSLCTVFSLLRAKINWQCLLTWHIDIKLLFAVFTDNGPVRWDKLTSAQTLVQLLDISCRKNYLIIVFVRKITGTD
jgi:hypothetical protein